MCFFVFLCGPEINWPQVQGFTSPSLEDSWDGLQLPECRRSGCSRRNNNNNLRDRGHCEREPEEDLSCGPGRRRSSASEPLSTPVSRDPLECTRHYFQVVCAHTYTHEVARNKRPGGRALLTPWMKHKSQTLPFSHDAKSSLTAHVDTFFP